MGKYIFETKWKEELICKSPEGTLVFEITMGELHVFFPSESKWLKDAPAWARDSYDDVNSELRVWCQENSIPITVVDDGYIGVLS